MNPGNKKVVTVTEDLSGKPDASRRGFMKMAATAGAGAALAMTGKTAEAAVDQKDAPDAGITRPDVIANIDTLPRPDVKFPMTGADVFAQACKAEVVAGFFCCPGNYGVISALVDTGIPSFSGRNEGSMVSAADAFTRATGEVSICSGTEGPGFTNMIGGLAAAYVCRSPVLMIASNRSFSLEDTQQGIQLLEQQPLTEGIKKYGKRLTQPARLPEYVAYAFRQLKSGIPGPVHLDFTLEVANHKFRSTDELGYYGNRAVYRTESRPAPSGGDIRKAVDLIRQAKRPIIVSSTGVFYSKAWDAVRIVAEKGQIPVVESGPMRGQFPDSHPLSASAAPGALASADLVILVGQYCMPTVGEFAFGPDAKYIRIQPAEAEDIGRNLPIDLGIVACEKLAMEEIGEALPKLSHDDWLSEIATARKAFEAENDKFYATGRAYTDAVHPAVIGKELADFIHAGQLPQDETTIASGGYGIARYVRRYIRAHRPAQIINGAYQYGAIGPDVAYGVGTAAAVKLGVGVQAAHKGHPIFVTTGDAGFGFTAMEIETMAKYRLPVIVIVYNNNAWGTWFANSKTQVHSSLHVFQENLRYDKLAEALGAHGEYVTRPEEFTPALKRAYQVALNDSLPTVINCQAKKEFWDKKQYEPGFLGTVEPGVMAYYH